MPKLLICILGVVVLGVVMQPMIIRAQETPEVTVIPQTIDQNKLPALQATYFGQLEAYRNQEQNYLVAVNQYHQLNTLASQEVAVSETRQLLSLRADVFLTYIEILDEMLNQGKGIPIENKAPERVVLSLLREKVLTHKNAVLASQDRFALDAEAANFLATYKELESHTYYTLSLIKVGDMQVAFDKSKVVRDAVKSYVDAQPLSTAVKAEKERGFAEIERNLQATEILFTPIKKDVFKPTQTTTLGDYTLLSSELNPVYSQINQIYTFLQEVRK